MAAGGPSVVVTGGSAGVGRAIALRFARAGARLTLIARSAEGLESARREIEAAGGEAITIAADTADADAVDRAAQEAIERWGGIDIWVNNAMVTMYAAVSDMTPAEYRRITEVTYLGYVHGTMAALRHMRSRNAGTIVQVGSALAYRAIPLQSAYCGAKYAVRGFTEALRSELIHDKSDVRLVAVQLPAVNTPQFDWARNVFPRRAQPVPPIFAPEAIADAVYRAARGKPREMWLGLPTLKLIVGAIVAPGFLDRHLAKAAYDGQFTNEPLPEGYHDNLFEPSDLEHRTHGRFGDRSKNNVVAFSPALLRLMLIGGGLVLLLAIIVILII